MPPPTLEFFFDCSSPATYLGFHNIQRTAARTGVPILWRPIIVGGVFNAVNQQVYDIRANPPVPRKAEYHLKDQQDWARYLGLTLNRPPKCGHPVNAVKCMRACLVLEPEHKLVPFAAAAFHALWVDGLDLGDETVLRMLCRQIDVDADRLMRQIEQPEIKQKLRANTDELIARNGFGSPTFFVNTSDMYWGNDRVLLVEAALERLTGRRP